MTVNVKIYADIVLKQKKERSMIEIKFMKKKIDGESVPRSRNVDMEKISHYIFGELGVNPDDILEIDLNTGRPDVKQILFKPGIDVDRFLNSFPDIYGDYFVEVSKLSQTEKKVSFRNVPSYLLNKEIRNLCNISGEVERPVNREKVNMTTLSGKVILITATRYVMMRLKSGKFFNNY